MTAAEATPAMFGKVALVTGGSRGIGAAIGAAPAVCLGSRQHSGCEFRDVGGHETIPSIS